MQSVFIDTTTAKSSSSADALAFLQRAARLLLEYNTRTELLRRRLREVAQALGLKVQVAVGYRSITLYTPEGGYTHSQAPEFRINIAVSSVVHHIIDDVCAGKLSPAQACSMLDDAERGAERHNRWILAAIFGLGAAALAALLSADMAGMLVIGVSSALGLLARQQLAKRHVMLFALPFTAALIGALCGGVVISMGWTQTPGICLIVPALMLVPGPHLINGLYDIIENNIQTGLPRLTLAAAILVAAAMGIFLGGWITLGLTTVPPWHSNVGHISLLADVALAGLASCSFGAFYNAPWRVLWTSIVCGMVGHGIRYVCLAGGLPVEVSTLFACLAIGLIATPMVARLRVPFAAIAFAGAVPMMPGVLMFSAIAGAMEVAFAGKAADLALVAGTLANLFKSGFVVGAMCLGLLLGGRLGDWILASRSRVPQSRQQPG